MSDQVTLLRTILIFLMLCVSSSAHAERQPADPAERDIMQRLLAGQELLFEHNYPAAMHVFRELQRDHPKSVAGYFGEMALLEARMLEQEDFHLQREFEDVEKRGKSAVSTVMQRYTLSPWELMYVGSYYGLSGLFRARQQDWLGAYALGTKSRQIFRRVLEVDPQFVDAHFGIGMYLYWRSVFIDRLKFLSFIPDKRAEGIALVERVARDGVISKTLAQMNLGVINFEEKKYGKAIEILSIFVERYPKNVLLRNVLGRVFLADKRYPLGVAQFEEILRVEPRLNKAHYFIAMGLVLQENDSLLPRALAELDEYMRSKPNTEWQSYVHYWRGRIAERQHNATLAREEYQKASKLNPALAHAQLRLRGLGGGL